MLWKVDQAGPDARWNGVVSVTDQLERARGAFLDPGWLFLAAGLALLGAVLIIPAQDDLREAEFLRDRALAIEAHRQSRLDRYQEYIAALDRQEPSLVVALAASQLNEIPADRSPLIEDHEAATASASVFPALEPPPLVLPERAKVDSMLQRWSTDDRSRLWLIAGGAFCVLLGLMTRAPEPGEPDEAME